MDTSEQYIKMCDCPEIQDNKVIQWEWGYYFYGKAVSRFGDDIWEEDLYRQYPCEEDCFYEVLPYGRVIKLPRQDQLQDMIWKNGITANDMFIATLLRFYEWFKNTPRPDVTTIEQLWLCFVMKAKHNKAWDGEKWKLSQS